MVAITTAEFEQIKKQREEKRDRELAIQKAGAEARRVKGKSVLRFPQSAFRQPGIAWRDNIPIEVPDDMWDAAMNPDNLDLYYHAVHDNSAGLAVCDSVVLWNASRTKRAEGVVRWVNGRLGQARVEIIRVNEFSPALGVDEPFVVPEE